MECLYTLQSFGIPSIQMPLVNGVTSNKKRRRKNKTKKNDTVVGDDNNNSILKLNKCFLSCLPFHALSHWFRKGFNIFLYIEIKLQVRLFLFIYNWV